MEQQRDDLHSNSVSDSMGTDKVFVFNCPYLGTLDDSDTSLAYPASANHCFRVDSATAVDLSHQESYCLTDQHPGCHVFQMASAAIIETEPELEQTAPEKGKRRLSLYALPLILVLILLAAIIWWPAPGTTIQESLVRGAQNDKEVSDGATLNGKPAPQPPKTEDAVIITAPESVTESSTGATLNDPDARKKAADEGSSAAATGRNNAADNVQNQTSRSTDMTEDSAQPAEAKRSAENNAETVITSEQSTNEPAVETEITIEETTSVDEEQTIAIDTSEASSASTTSEVAAANVAEETISDAVEEKTISDAVEEETDEQAATEETDESIPVVTTDLPVISSATTAVSTAPAETVRTIDTGNQTILVGPAASTALSLANVSEDPSFLQVYQAPAGGGAPISQIESKQFVTLLGRSTSGDWLNVRLADGIEGWISASKSGARAEAIGLPVENEQSIPAVTSYPVIRSAYIDTGALNVRSGPGVEYEALTIVNSGEIVGMIGRRALGPWVRVRLDSGLEGWVNSSLLAPLS